MTTDAELEQGASKAVTALLQALRDGDVERYYALMSDADKAVMSLDAMRESTASMQQATGRLRSFSIEGIVLHPAAGHAAAHVMLEFENAPPKTELYNLTLQEDGWRLDFDLAGLSGLDDD